MGGAAKEIEFEVRDGEAGGLGSLPFQIHKFLI